MEKRDGVKAELVESGTFRIDRDRALQKLRDFQLSNPGEFYLDLARAAALSKPSYVRVKADGPTLTIAFDGKPLPKAVMQDPFSPLFADGGLGERERCLAFGLLAALRAKARSLTLESRDGSERVLLRMDALNSLERLDPGEDEKETILTLTWDGPLEPRRVSRAAPADLGLLDADLILNGKNLGKRPLAAAPGHALLDGAAGADFLAVAGYESFTGNGGILVHYIHGVRAAGPLPYGGKERARLTLHVEHKEFALNLSRATVNRSKKSGRIIRDLFNRADNRFQLRRRLRIIPLLLVVIPALLPAFYFGGEPAWMKLVDKYYRVGMEFSLRAFFFAMAIPLFAFLPFYAPNRRAP